MLSSFRFRLTLWNLCVMALALTGYAVVQGWMIQRNLESSIDRDLWNRGHRFAGWWAQIDPNFLPDMPTGSFGWPGGPRLGQRSRRPPGPGVPPTPLGSSGADRRGFFARPRVLGVDGESLVPFSSETAWDNEAFIVSLAGKETYTTTSYEQDEIRVFSMPLRRLRDGQASVEGVIQVAHPLAEQRRMAEGLIRTPLTLIPFALALAGLGAVFLANRALRPVLTVTQTAAEIREQDLSRRLTVTGNDELAALAATFNGMIARLESAFAGREEAFRQLEASYEQQRRFTGDASHELRTPLTRIKACASLALSRERTGEEYVAALATVNRAADDMQRLIDDLLILARADAGRLEMDRSPQQMPKLIAEAATEVSAGPPIQLRLDPDLPEIRGDAAALRRVFVNLFDNARRHTPPEGEIEVTSACANGSVRITVRDTGEGIPADALSHLGERFYRADAARTRSRGGTGLGLAICRSIAEAHGGRIEIESDLGVGTSVSLWLPVEPPSGPQAERADA